MSVVRHYPLWEAVPGPSVCETPFWAPAAPCFPPSQPFLSWCVSLLDQHVRAWTLAVWMLRSSELLFHGFLLIIKTGSWSPHDAGCFSNGRGAEHQEPGWHVAACTAARVRPLHSGGGCVCGQWAAALRPTPHSVLPSPRSGTTSGP